MGDGKVLFLFSFLSPIFTSAFFFFFATMQGRRVHGTLKDTVEGVQKIPASLPAFATPLASVHLCKDKLCHGLTLCFPFLETPDSVRDRFLHLIFILLSVTRAFLSRNRLSQLK